jgi:agmatinase
MILPVADSVAGLFGWRDFGGAMPCPDDLCVFGAPSDEGNVVRRGAALGPAAIRRAASERVVESGGWDIGDISRSYGVDFSHYLEEIAATARALAGRGLVPLMLGGDHSLTFAPVAALLETRELYVVWLDAHTDFSIWNESNYHNHKQVLRRIATLSNLGGIVQIGYRGITTGDERSLGRGTQVVTSACAQRMSTHALLSLIPDDRPCYISIDIDVVDPFFAPGTSTPVPGGLKPEVVSAFLRLLTSHREIVGIDLTETNPVVDLGGRSVAVACELLAVFADAWPAQRKLREIKAMGEESSSVFSVHTSR